MSEDSQQKPQQNLNTSGDASLENVQIGGIAGRDLNVSQIQGKFVSVSINSGINAQDGLSPQSTIAPPLTGNKNIQRRVLLNKVKNQWVKEFLENSLRPTKALVELGLLKRMDLVQSPFSGMEEFHEESGQPLPEGTRTIDLFNQMGKGKTLLISGEPGSGKTITLIKLAQSLIVRYEKKENENLNLPIPVVFNLSSWVSKKHTIIEWLIEQLYSQYQVPKLLGKEFIKNQQLILLLDGLDEVKAEYQNNCVRELNEFIKSHGTTEIAVCCRIQDYKALSERLILQSGIYIQPLTIKQIYKHLDIFGDQLTGFKTFLQQNAQLQELARSPLILNVMILTYGGCSLGELPSFGSVEEYEQSLYQAYIERMLTRKSNTQIYQNEQTKLWLHYLAERMLEKSQTFFLIEEIQPSWLSLTRDQDIYHVLLRFILGLILGINGGIYLIYFSHLVLLDKWNFKLFPIILIIGFLSGLFSGVMFGIIYMFIAKNSNKLIEILISGVILSLNFAIFLKLFNLPVNKYIQILVVFAIYTIASYKFIKTKIRVTETKKINANKIKNYSILGFIFGVLYMLTKKFLTFLFKFPFYETNDYRYMVFDIVIFSIIGALYGGLKLEKKEISKKTVLPNDGIKKSLKYASIYFAILTLIIPFLAWSMDNPKNPFYFIYVGLSSGVSGWLIAVEGSGITTIKHFILRLLLYNKKCIPWNYARFLDYVSQHLLMKKIGGSYVFYHRKLMEHFAKMML